MTDVRTFARVLESDQEIRKLQGDRRAALAREPIRERRLKDLDEQTAQLARKQTTAAEEVQRLEAGLPEKMRAAAFDGGATESLKQTRTTITEKRQAAADYCAMAEVLAATRAEIEAERAKDEAAIKDLEHWAIVRAHSLLLADLREACAERLFAIHALWKFTNPRAGANVVPPEAALPWPTITGDELAAFVVQIRGLLFEGGPGKTDRAKS